ncbi:hypothetical protein PybrP1_004412 [[Pythium] brassicae (nom. inval.)]|nr:hypothetical protein PybrP1_004412 [[Pythium] brassicae (nom. inval.)]
MFARYNKDNAKGTLVGNWVEEEALRAGTGFSRRKVPAPYAAPDRKESRCESTLDRVLLHTRPGSESSPESAFETTNQATTRYGAFGVQSEPPAPRSTRRDLALLEQAKQICEQQEQQRELELQSQIPTDTLTKSSYLPLDPALLASSTRVPRGRNGRRVVDPTIQHLTKQQVDSIDQMKLDLLQGNAVTRYSYAVATGVGLDFATSASDSANPFGRSSAFSNEITDSSKRHGEATEPGSALDERVGATLHQRSALQRLLAALERDPAASRQLADMLTDRSQGEFIQIGDFRSAWSEVLGGTSRLGLRERDAVHVFMHFDVQSIGAIRLPHFIEFCRSGALHQQQSLPLSTRST